MYILLLLPMQDGLSEWDDEKGTHKACHLLIIQRDQTSRHSLNDAVDASKARQLFTPTFVPHSLSLLSKVKGKIKVQFVLNSSWLFVTSISHHGWYI